MYLNYFREEVNDEMDAEPIGIILCTDKENVQAEYALGGISNTIFASRYTQQNKPLIMHRVFTKRS